uniref:Uncharacterized protein n=1 Tax=Panagrolaimus sp. ES5 TaxID=591445 RepID=A0AC34FYV2_9BILA
MNTKKVEVHREVTKEEVPYEQKTTLGKVKEAVKDTASALKEAVTGEGTKETVHLKEKTYTDSDGNVRHEKVEATRER